MKLVTIGTIGLDTIETPFGKGKNILGGSATYSALAASYHTVPGLVAVAGQDFTDSHRKIYTDNNIDITGLEILHGKTFAWGGKYDFNLNDRTTLFTELNTLAEFDPKLPDAYKSAEYVFLGNIHPSLQIKVLNQLQKPKFVGLDTMNYWMENSLDELKQVLGKIDVLIINEGEARELSAEHNLVKAATKIFTMMQPPPQPSPKGGGSGCTLIIKQGEYGLLMFQLGSPSPSIFNLPGYPLEDVVDPTGAGDSFAGGFMGYLAATDDTTWENLKKACVAGSMMASFCVEKMGTGGLIGIKKDQIKERTEKFKELTEI